MLKEQKQRLAYLTSGDFDRYLEQAARPAKRIKGERIVEGQNEPPLSISMWKCAQGFFNARAFAVAWDDSTLKREGRSEDGGFLLKARKELKFKEGIPKRERRKIHFHLACDILALLAEYKKHLTVVQEEKSAILQSLQSGSSSCAVESELIARMVDKFQAAVQAATHGALESDRQQGEGSEGGQSSDGERDPDDADTQMGARITAFGEDTDDEGWAGSMAQLWERMPKHQPPERRGDWVPFLSEVVDSIPSPEDVEKLRLQDQDSGLLAHLRCDPGFEKSNMEEQYHNMEEKYKAAIKAIEHYKTHTDKALGFLSQFFAVFGGFASGAATAGALFAILMATGVGMPVAIVIAIVAFLAGFVANYNYFSKTIVDFLHKLTHGGLSEYINEEGKRTQLSLKTKFFLGLAFCASLAVGGLVAVFTVCTITKVLGLIATLASVGALTVANPWILAVMVILGVAIAVAMAVITFKAFVDIAPKLSIAYIRKAFIDFFTRPTSFAELCKRIAKVLFVPFLLIGLAALAYAGLHSLVGFLTPVFGAIGAQVVSWTISLAAFFAQSVFVAKTGAQFCDFMFEKMGACYLGIAHVLRRVRGSDTLSVPTMAVAELESGPSRGEEQQCLLPVSPTSSPSPVSFVVRAGDMLGGVYKYGAIALNAAGNAALVAGSSPMGVVNATSTGFMSAAANLLPPDEALRVRREAETQKGISMFFQKQSQPSFAESEQAEHNSECSLAASISSR